MLLCFYFSKLGTQRLYKYNEFNDANLYAFPIQKDKNKISKQEILTEQTDLWLKKIQRMFDAKQGEIAKNLQVCRKVSLPKLEVNSVKSSLSDMSYISDQTSNESLSDF